MHHFLHHFYDKENVVLFRYDKRQIPPPLPKWGSGTVIVEYSSCHSERKVILSYRKRGSGIIWKWTDKSVINQKINLQGFFKWRSFTSFQNDGYDYHFGKVGRRAFANDGHFYHFLHSANEGHIFPLKRTSRKPSRRPHRHYPYCTANRAVTDLSRQWTTERISFIGVPSPY